MHLGPLLEPCLTPVHQKNWHCRPHLWFPVSLRLGIFDLAQSTISDKRVDDLSQPNTVSPPPTAPLPSRRPTTIDSSFPKERPLSASISKWRFLPGFLSPTSPQSNRVLVHPGTAVQLTHTKGDIVCLDYNTLDDREMRRLEGRSDHRPVIGTYVISLW